VQAVPPNNHEICAAASSMGRCTPVMSPQLFTGHPKKQCGMLPDRADPL
jgi:hypothetical protein